MTNIEFWQHRWPTQLTGSADIQKCRRIAACNSAARIRELSTNFHPAPRVVELCWRLKTPAGPHREPHTVPDPDTPRFSTAIRKRSRSAVSYCKQSGNTSASPSAESTVPPAHRFVLIPTSTRRLPAGNWHYLSLTAHCLPFSEARSEVVQSFPLQADPDVAEFSNAALLLQDRGITRVFVDEGQALVSERCLDRCMQ
jgi:hypothetical protein